MTDPTPMPSNDIDWNKLTDILDEQFPKGKCKERGQALVLIAYAKMALETSDRLWSEKVKELEERNKKLQGILMRRCICEYAVRQLQAPSWICQVHGEVNKNDPQPN